MTTRSKIQSALTPALKTRDFAAVYEEAVTLQKKGRYAEAEARCRALLKRLPDHPHSLHLLGVLHYQQGMHEKAEALIRKAIGLHPAPAHFHNNLGNVLKDQERPEAAARCYQEALRLRKNYGGARGNLRDLALSLHARGDSAGAAGCLKHVIRNQPRDAEAHLHLGAVRISQHLFSEAVASLETALRLDPGNPTALFNLALARKGLNQIDSAKSILQTLLDLSPEDAAAWCLFCQVQSLRCDWKGYEQRVANLVGIAGEDSHVQTAQRLPLLTLHRHSVPPALIKALTEKHAEIIEAQAAPARDRCSFEYTGEYPGPAKGLLPEPRRLRIGYVSADFRRHAVGWMVKDMFRHHDRRYFKVHAYSLVPKDDPVTQDIRGTCDAYTDMSRLTVEASAQRIHEDGIHVLVDLTGYTTFSRPEIFALRPAPVQVHYLGYPGTMGARFMDCILADETVIPPEAAIHYTERIVYLPECFCVTSRLPVNPEPVTRKQADLPEEAFVFSCFNHPYKIDPPTFTLWMRILKQVPHSVLWLAAPQFQRAADNLKGEALKRGVDPGRILFAPNIPLSRHLARCTLSDLFLDTLSYNAGATAVGVLQRGLPLLTVPGHSFVSRMGASLLNAAGLPELIAENREAYVEKAVHLATHREALLPLRKRLLENRNKAPLFDTGRWVRHLEEAFRLIRHQDLRNRTDPIRVPLSPPPKGPSPAPRPMGPLPGVCTPEAAAEAPAECNCTLLGDISLKTVLSYRRLTFPDVTGRWYMRRPIGSLHMALALHENRPMGALLAECNPARAEAEIISLFVVPQYRRQGIAGHLTAFMEQALVKKEYRYMMINFRSDWKHADGLKKLLKRGKWEPTKVSFIIFKSRMESVSKAPPVLNPPAVPADCELFPWEELKDRERTRMLQRQRERPWFPAQLSPFQTEDRMEVLCSTGLRVGGEVAGWFIAHRISGDTVQYTALFIRKDLRNKGLVLPLLAQSFRRHIASGIPFSVFRIDAGNRKMLKFVEKFSSPFQPRVAKSLHAHKLLPEV